MEGTVQERTCVSCMGNKQYIRPPYISFRFILVGARPCPSHHRREDPRGDGQLLQRILYIEQLPLHLYPISLFPTIPSFTYLVLSHVTCDKLKLICATNNGASHENGN
ncbi:hypothetical protein ACQJBY_062978 [Aegilops geniculata]